MDIVHGQDSYLSARVGNDYYIVGCDIVSKFGYGNQIIGKTDVNAGLMLKKRARIGFSRASVSGLVKLNSDDSILSIFYFLQEAVRRSEIDFRFEWYGNSGYKQLNLTAIIEDIEITGDVNDFAMFDMSLQSTNTFSLSDIVGPPPTGNSEAANILSDTFAPQVGAGWVNSQGNETGIWTQDIPLENIIEVDREGLQYDYDPSGALVGRTWWRDNIGKIWFHPDTPFGPDETVFIIFKEP